MNRDIKIARRSAAARQRVVNRKAKEKKEIIEETFKTMPKKHWLLLVLCCSAYCYGAYLASILILEWLVR